MKSEYQERRFKMNAQTSVVIRSTRDKVNTDLYHNTITVVHQTSGLEPLDLKSRVSLEQAIKAIELEDPQTALELPSEDYPTGEAKK